MTVQVVEKKEPAEAGESHPDARWELLGRVASSTPMKRATRLQKLLLYLGQSTLKDGRDQMHEQEIGVAVFGRPDSYDTSIDNIVRTNVSDLRKRIETYFRSEGLLEPLIMEIPRGSYLPVFRQRTAEPNSETESPASAVAQASPPDGTAEEITQASARRRWILAGGIVAAVAIVVLGAVSLVLWHQARAMDRSLYAWKYKSALAAFWSGFLGSGMDTDVVMPDTSFAMVESISKRTFSFNEYLSRNYVSQLEAQDMSADTRTALGLVAARNLGTPSGFKLTERILALDPLGKRIHSYYARDYMPDLLKRDNVILIGARIANPWDELFESRMNFTAKTENSFTMIVNRAPAAGERQTYTRTESVGYCEVAYLPNPSGIGKVLLIEGTSAEATEAAGDFLLSDDQLANFRKMLHTTEFPYFEMLLKISAVRGTPLTVTVEAYRTYPKL